MPKLQSAKVAKWKFANFWGAKVAMSQSAKDAKLQCLSAKVQSAKVAKYQSWKVLKLQSAKIAKCQCYKVTKMQSAKAKKC